MSAALSTPTDSQATAVAATPAPTPAATPAVEQKAAPETATQQQPTAAERLLAKAFDKAPDGEKAAEPTKEAEKAAPAAPEKYEPWKLPEGVKLSDDINGAFSELARKAGLSQADAQASLDKLVTAQQEQIQTDLKTQVESWYESVIKDPEIGGDRFESQTLPNMLKALEAFDKSGEAAAVLRNGLLYQPGMARMLDAIGKAVSQHSDLVTGQRFAPRSATVDDLYEATKVK